MANTKKPNKKYNPNKYAGAPLSPFLIKKEPVSDHDTMQMKIWPHASLRALQDGTAKPDDWQTLLYRVTSTLFVADAEFDKETVSGIIAAEDVLVKAFVEWREHKTYPIQLTVEQVDAIYPALVAADEIHELVSRNAMLRGFQKAKEYLKKHKYY